MQIGDAHQRKGAGSGGVEGGGLAWVGRGGGGGMVVVVGRDLCFLFVLTKSTVKIVFVVRQDSSARLGGILTKVADFLVFNLKTFLIY